MTISLSAKIPCASNPSPSPKVGKQCKYSGQSVRALPIRLITVGKKRSKGVQLLVEAYQDKLKVYCHVDDIQIRPNPKNTSDVNDQIEGEDMAVMQHIRSEDWVVLLDEHGLDIGSLQMADLLGDAGNTFNLSHDQIPDLQRSSVLKIKIYTM